MELSKKQIKFCEEYVKDYNGTQAAIRAGYKESNAATQAGRLLKQQAVLDKIKQHQKKLVDESCLSEEKVINDLQEVLKRCLSAEPVMKWDYDEKAWVETGLWEFNAKGALDAIKLLGQHLGMFANKVDLTVNKDAIKEMEDYLEQRAAGRSGFAC